MGLSSAFLPIYSVLTLTQSILICNLEILQFSGHPVLYQDLIYAVPFIETLSETPLVAINSFQNHSVVTNITTHLTSPNKTTTTMEI